MGKTTFTKIWKAALGIVTEMILATFIIASALGISWLIANVR